MGLRFLFPSIPKTRRETTGGILLSQVLASNPNQSIGRKKPMNADVDMDSSEEILAVFCDLIDALWTSQQRIDFHE